MLPLRPYVGEGDLASAGVHSEVLEKVCFLTKLVAALLVVAIVVVHLVVEKVCFLAELVAALLAIAVAVVHSVVEKVSYLAEELVAGLARMW